MPFVGLTRQGGQKRCYALNIALLVLFSYDLRNIRIETCSHTNLQRLFIIQKAAVFSIINSEYDHNSKHLFQILGMMTFYSFTVYKNLVHINFNLHKFSNYAIFMIIILLQRKCRVIRTRTMVIPLDNSLPLETQRYSTRL